MFRPLRPRATVVVARRLPCFGLARAAVILWAFVTASGDVDAGSYEGLANPTGDGLSSVVIENLGDMPAATVQGDEGWTISDGGETPDVVSDPLGPCPDGQCPGPACQPWNHVPGLINKHLGDACPRLVWSVDALMLWQGNVASRPLYTVPSMGLTALDANQLAAPVSVGPRVGLILNLTQCHGIEANWFDVQPFSGDRLLGSGASTYTMDNVAGMNLSDIGSAVVAETAVFRSFELNWRRRTCSPLTWLAGFRWVEWDQTLGINDFYDNGVVAGTDAASVVTGNNLYGGQLGVDALLWNTGHWVTVNGVAKAGVFYNYQAYQRTNLLGDREFGNFSAVDDGTAFVGEVGINGTVRICNWLSWRAGYNFFWLSGLAVPASQLSVTNQPTPPTTALDHSGSVFLHGVNTGLEARW